jgi:polysaccharide export outer membrane protein
MRAGVLIQFALFLIVLCFGEEKITQGQEITTGESDKVERVLDYEGCSVKLANSEKSIIELSYSERLPELEVKQFGYDVFQTPPERLFLPVGRDYILGPGDELVFYLWGDPVEVLQMESIYKATVDREGKIFIPAVGLITAWGKTLEEVKTMIRQILKKKFKKFKIDISVSKIRSFPVYVSGSVRKPGIVLTTGVNNVFDVLALAGGIIKTGSLRHIIIRRKEEGRLKEITIDLYDLLIKGENIEIRVRDGDVLFVPPIGRTVAIAGSVNRPGIYEIKDEKTISEMISLAGGFLPSSNREIIKVLRIENGVQKTYEVSTNDPFEVADGDILVIENIYPKHIENEIIVEGFVAYPGRYSAANNPTLQDLIEKVGLLPETDLERAEILRKDGKILSVSLYEIKQKKGNVRLEPGDKIRFFKKWEYEPIEVSGEILNPRIIPYFEGMMLRDALRDIKYKSNVRELKVVLYRKNFVREKLMHDEKQNTSKSIDLFSEDFTQLLSSLTYAELKNIKLSIERKIKNIENLLEKFEDNRLKQELSTLLQKLNIVNTKIHDYQKRGIYFVGYLFDILVKGERNLYLAPGDKIVLVKKLPEEKKRTVTILGEVNRPGVYSLEEGMTLYDLLKKAGGPTKYGYLKGLIFIRESARKLQEQQLRIAISAIEETLARGEENLELAGGSFEERLAKQMAIKKQKELLELIKRRARAGLGRIALEIPRDLEDLKNSHSNIQLVHGDYIFVPPKPNYVLVIGDVFNQVAIPFREGMPLSYYLQAVGGPGKSADLDNLYVIKANGKVISKRNFKRFLTFRWDSGKLFYGMDFMSMPLEEGDTIVVPAELKIPVMWRPLLKDIVQIIFQSISTAVLAQRL